MKIYGRMLNSDVESLFTKGAQWWPHKFPKWETGSVWYQPAFRSCKTVSIIPFILIMNVIHKIFTWKLFPLSPIVSNTNMEFQSRNDANFGLGYIIPLWFWNIDDMLFLI